MSIALCLLAFAPPVAAETVLLADGRELKGVEMKAGSAPDRVRLDRGLEAPLEVGKDEVLMVDFGKTPGRATVPAVRLLNGDQFNGKVSFPGGREVKVGTAWGMVTFPFAWCASVRLAEKTELPAPGPRDAILPTNGDRVEGEIRDVKNGKVFFQIAGAPDAPALQLDVERVKALSFARSEPPAEVGSGLLVALDLGASERLTARWLAIEGDNLKVQPAWGGTLEIPLAAVSRMEVKNGKLVYLSDLKPSQAEQTPYIEGEYPHRLNQSVGGRPIRLAGKSYRRGIGVHARSSIAFTLEGKFKTFAATLGVDSEVGAHGSVLFRVYGDEKRLFESQVVRGGDDPIEISLDVNNVHSLRLEVDYADNGDVADPADWADARLLRP